MGKVIDIFKNYKPYNEQEKEDVSLIISAENLFGDILTRDNKFCHLTASGFIVNKQRTKVLCIFHNIYKSWTWVGGHADGCDDLMFVAQKEISEETSLKNFKPIIDDPISVEILPVKGHFKNGRYVSAHQHLNVTYLFEADENESIHILEEENSDIAWLMFDELIKKSDEEHMIPVYKKIIERLKTI